MVESLAEYAAAQEFGTSKIAPRPAARPATERNRKKVVQMVGDAVNITIR